MKFAYLAFLSLLAQGVQGHDLRDLLETRPLFRAIGREDILDRYLHTARFIPVAEFIEAFETAGHQKRLGQGVEGTVVKDRGPYVWKVSHGVLEAIGTTKIRPENNLLTDDERKKLKKSWSKIRSSRRLPPRSKYAYLESRGWPFRNAPLFREIVGSLFWSHYAPHRTSTPEWVAEDFHGYRGEFIPGPTLDQLLRDSEARKQYAHLFPEIWKQLVDLQHINERIMMETGYVVDLFSPANIIVSGTEDAPVLVPIDRGISRPDEQVLQWLARHEVYVPEPVEPFFAKKEKIWAISPLVVANRLWHLTYEQALEYIGTYFRTRTRKGAERRLAKLHVWDKHAQAKLFDPKHILEARAQTGSETGLPEIAQHFSCPDILRR